MQHKGTNLAASQQWEGRDYFDLRIMQMQFIYRFGLKSNASAEYKEDIYQIWHANQLAAACSVS